MSPSSSPFFLAYSRGFSPRRLQLLILFLFSVLPRHGLCSQEPLTAESVKSEVLKHAAVAERRFRQVQGRGSLEIRQNRKFRKPPTSHRSWREIAFAIDGLSYKLSFRNRDTGAAAVTCVTPKNSFLVRRESGSGPYSVSAFNDPILKASIDSWLLRFLYSSFTLADVPLREVMTDPSFAIKRISAVPIGTKQCVKIDYDYAPKDHLIGGGWLVVSPQEGWVIRSYRCQLDRAFPDRSTQCEVEYGEPPTGPPFPRRVSYVQRGPTDNDYLAEFEDIETKETPESEFSITSYGLPDLASLRKPRARTNAALWYLATALGLLAAAFILRNWGARLQRK